MTVNHAMVHPLIYVVCCVGIGMRTESSGSLAFSCQLISADPRKVKNRRGALEKDQKDLLMKVR